MRKKVLFAVLTLLAGLGATEILAAPVEIVLSFTVTDEVSSDFDVFADVAVAGEPNHLHVAQCETVSIDDVGDASLVVPIVCDGAHLGFVLSDAGISVLRDGERLSEIKLEPGPYFVNGLPVLVE